MTIAPSTASPATMPQVRYWYWRGWKIRYLVWYPACTTAAVAPPLLLLHGFGASLEQWRDNLPALAQQRTVYALDLLGFGASQKAATHFRVELWSDQVQAFWQTWMGRPMVVIGHSLGALVGLASAIAAPSMVTHLVMLTLPAARDELLAGWVGTLSRWLEQGFSTPLLIRPLFSMVRQPWIIRGALQGIYRHSRRVDASLIDQFVQPTRDRGAARTVCYLVRSRTDPHFTPPTKQLIAQLTVPTLLLWGAADNVIPLSWGQQIAPLNRHITLQVLPGGGHCLYDEQPQQVNQAILTWLAETLATPSQPDSASQI